MNTTSSSANAGPRGLVDRITAVDQPVFSLCCMLTDWNDYEEAVASFRERGFTDDVCEYLIIDNSRGNKADAYVAVNEFLQTAQAPHVVLHHQDVRMLEHGRATLEGLLAELTRVAPHWGVAGNAGMTSRGVPVRCLSHPDKDVHITGGPFPAHVVSLDENFLVVRREANLAVSRDLTGFHHYGADLCVLADVLGHTAHVIDFFLRHNSGGSLDGGYDDSGQRFTAKYRRALRSRRLELITNRPVFLSPSRLYAAASPPLRKARKALGLLPRARHHG